MSPCSNALATVGLKHTLWYSNRAREAPLLKATAYGTCAVDRYLSPMNVYAQYSLHIHTDVIAIRLRLATRVLDLFLVRFNMDWLLTQAHVTPYTLTTSRTVAAYTGWRKRAIL